MATAHHTRTTSGLEEPLKQASRPLVGEVFAFADELPVQARLALSALLAAPGHPPAILPGQLAASSLPVDLPARSEIPQAIEAGLTPQAIESLAHHRLGAVVPALARCDPDAVVRSAPAHVRALLSTHAAESATLARFTVREICGWPGVGPRRVAQLVGAAVGAASDFVAERHLGPDWIPDRCLALLTEALATAGDERDRGVFENGVLPLGSPVTRPELATALGVSAEQARRLARRTAGRVRAALDQAPAAVGELAVAVSERLGAAAPRAAVDDALASHGLPALPDTRSRLLLWAAGPYQEVDGHPGWIAVDPAGLIGRTKQVIHEDGGVRPLEHVAEDLRLEGIDPAHIECWLARQPVRVADGLVVATTGRASDVAERALHAFGRPMTVDEIAAWMHREPQEFDQLRAAPDRRFAVTGVPALALVEWGGDPGPVSA